MELLERPLVEAPLVGTGTDERAARGMLRSQIAKLEAELASVACASFPEIPLTSFASGHAGPRILGLAELEQTRDQLAMRLRELKQERMRRADEQEDKRLLIERMLLAPAKYKWVRVTNGDIGEPGCKSFHVRPRLGLVGMLAGWWHVKVSSGCPLAGGPWQPPRSRPAH